MTIVYLGIAIWAIVIAVAIIDRVFADRPSRPLTDSDRYCSRADERLDEIAAQRALRPHGSCEVIPIRGWQANLRDDPSLSAIYQDFDPSRWTDGAA